MNDYHQRSLGRALDLVIERGFIDLRSIALGDFRMVLRESRNLSFAVIRRHGPSILVKVPRLAEARETIRREALFYRAVRANPDLEGIREWVPRFVSDLDAEGGLVLELVPEAQTIAEARRRTGPVAPAVFRSLGSALGAVRRATQETDGRAAGEALFPREIPWILRAASPLRNDPADRHRGTGRVLDWLRGRPSLVAMLDRARTRWRVKSLINADLKLPNCIVPKNGRDRVTLIDWELAALGDPAWDVAGAVQSLWTTEMLAARPGPIGVADARERTSELAEELWSGYGDACPFLGPSDARAERQIVDLYVRCRLLQSAYELCQNRTDIPEFVVALLHQVDTWESEAQSAPAAPPEALVAIS